MRRRRHEDGGRAARVDAWRVQRALVLPRQALEDLALDVRKVRAQVRLVKKSEILEAPPATGRPRAGATPSTWRTRSSTARTGSAWKWRFGGSEGEWRGGGASPARRKRTVGLSSSERTNSGVHAGHAPQRSTKKQRLGEPSPIAAATGGSATICVCGRHAVGYLSKHCTVQH